MPRAVRDKLDRVAIKLHLEQWQALAVADRQSLVDAPCEDETQIETYEALVTRLLADALGVAPDRLPTLATKE